MSRTDAKFLKKFWTEETPSGTINGSNVTFVLSHDPVENESVKVFINGLRQITTVDYSISGVTITMVTAPALGQSISVDYIRNTGE